MRGRRLRMTLKIVHSPRRFQFDSRSRRLWLLAALIATVMASLDARLRERRGADSDVQPTPSSELRAPKIEFIELN